MQDFRGSDRRLRRLCLAHGPAVAAAYSPWSYFDKTRGLAENTVQAIAPDGAGGLWVGTRGGLSHFDGALWRTLTVADGLPDDDVHSLAPEAPDRLWVGAGSGFGRIEAGRWGRLGLPGSATGQRGKVVVATDRDGVTWLGHAGGLLRFDRAAGVLEPVPEVAGQPVGALLVDREGRFWAGVGGDLWRRDDGGWRRVEEAARLPCGAVTVLFEDADGTIWCGGERGVAEFDGSSWRRGALRRRDPGGRGDRDGRGRRGPCLGRDAPRARATRTATSGTGSPRARGCRRTRCSRWPPTATVRSGSAPRAGSPASTPPGRSPPSPDARGCPRGRPCCSAATARSSSARSRVSSSCGGALVETVGPRERLEGRVRCFAEGAAGDLWVGTDRGLARYDGTVREQHSPKSRRVHVERAWGAVEAREGCRLRPRPRTDRRRGDRDRRRRRGRGLGRHRAGTEPSARGGLELSAGGRRRGRRPAAGRRFGARASTGRGRLWVGTSKGLWVLEDGSWRRYGAGRRPGRRRGDGAAGGPRRSSLGRDGARAQPPGGGLLGDPRRPAGARQRPRADAVRGCAQAGSGSARRRGSPFSTTGSGAPSASRMGCRRRGSSSIARTRRLALVRRRGRAWASTAPTARRRAPGSPTRPPGRSAHRRISSSSPAATSKRRPAPALSPGASTAAPGRTGPPSRSRRSPTWPTAATCFEARCLDAELNVDPTPAAVAFEVNTGLFDLELVDAAFGPLYASLYQFYANDPEYEQRPAGRVDDPQPLRPAAAGQGQRLPPRADGFPDRRRGDHPARARRCACRCASS